MKAVGLNFADAMQRVGLYDLAPALPYIGGYEGAGEVVAVGSGVSDFEVGQRVIVVLPFGIFQHTLVVPQHYCFAIPEGMSWAEAAALPVNYLTAYLMLYELGGLRPGKSVLVHMVAGGVGTAVSQLCRAEGDCRVFGTASASKHDYARAQGCTDPIDYRSVDFEEAVNAATDGEGVDIILDPLAGSAIAKHFRLLKPLGKYVLYGGTNYYTGGSVNAINAVKQWWSTPNLKVMSLPDGNKSYSGFHLGHLVDKVDMIRAAMAHLLEKYAAGDIQPHVDSVFPLTAAGMSDAHRYMSEGRNLGKILLAVNPDEIELPARE